MRPVGYLTKIDLTLKALFASALVLSGIAHSSDLRFQHLGVDEGLSHNWVWSITQDQHGFIWVGTDGGLVRFDGHETLTYQQSDGLGSNQVRSVFVDSSGAVWVGSNQGGLSRSRDTQTFEAIQFPAGAAVDTVYDIVESDGLLFLATNSGLFSIEIESNHARHVGASRNLRIYTLALDQEKNVWLGTRSGVYIYHDRGDRSLNQVTLGEHSNNKVYAIAVDQQNTVWIAIGTNLYRRFNHQHQPIQVNPDQFAEGIITSLVALRSGAIAVGGLGGLQLYQPGPDQTYRFKADGQRADSLRDDRIYALFEDSAGSLWTGSFQGGASYTNPAMLDFGLQQSHPNCPTHQANDILLDSSGRLIVASATAVSYQLANGDCDFLTITDNSIAPTSYSLLFEDHRQRLWVALEPSGLALVDIDDRRIEPVRQSTIESLLIGSIGNSDGDSILLGSIGGQGLTRFNPIDQSVRSLERLEGLSIYEIHPWRLALLLATDSGALLYQPESNSLTSPFNLPNRPEVQTILLNEQDDEIWLGTRSDGLFRFDSVANTIHSVDSNEGIQGTSVRAAGIDAMDTIWVNSNRGLFYRVKEESKFRHFQRSDGLQGNEASALFLNHWTTDLLIAGIGGINRINTRAVTRPGPLPHVKLTHFGTNTTGRPPLWNAQQQVVLKHTEKDFSFTMAALNFDDSTRSRYAYRLLPYQEEWRYTDAKQRQIDYTNLPPGTYILEARAANKSGRWGTSEQLLQIKILAAPWNTTLARTLYLIALIIAVWALLHWRTRQANKQAQQLRSQVKSRTREIEHQKHTIEALLTQKRQLFAAISHELRTPLTLLSGPLQSLRNKLGTQQHEHQELHLIQRSSARLVKLVDQLLLLVKLDRQAPQSQVPVAVDPIIDGLVAAFVPLAKTHSITIRLERRSAGLWIWALPDTLETVMSNLLSNAIKYSDAQTEVVIRVTEDESNVVICVIDQGIGIAESDLNMLFEHFFRSDGSSKIEGTGLGLAIARESALASGGDLTASSAPGKGSTFNLRLERYTESSPTTEHLLPAPEELAIPSIAPTTAVQTAISEDGPLAEIGAPVVLIIEDDDDMRAFIVNCLAHRFRCVAEASGEQGLATALELQPDLVISDIVMPGQSGLEVSRALRSDERTSHVPILLLTALADDAHRRQGWNEQVDEYLGKPFDPEELLIRAESLISIRAILRRQFGKRFVTDGTQALLESPQLPERESNFLKRLDKIVQQKYRYSEFGPEQMASHCAMSLRQLQRKLKQLMDCSPGDYLRDFRLEKAAELLQQGKPVGVVSDECGFGSPRHFGRSFKTRYEMTPKQFRSQVLNHSDNQST